MSPGHTYDMSFRIVSITCLRPYFMTLGSPWHIEKMAPLLARRPALDLSMTSSTIAGMHTPIGVMSVNGWLTSSGQQHNLQIYEPPPSIKWSTRFCIFRIVLRRDHDYHHLCPTNYVDSKPKEKDGSVQKRRKKVRL
jgi:hypothetical protein